MGFKTTILPRHLLDKLKQRRPLYHVGRKARFAVGSSLGARHVEGLGSRAHFNDFMLKGSDPASVESYRQGAVEFVGILREALAANGRDWDSVAACLEIGCGYGRIVRELRRELPPAAISVADTIDEAASFTASEFGVRRIPVAEETGAEFNDAFDLVYLLSVYTHLSVENVEANLRRVAAMIKPGGVLVFTTHGSASAASAELYEQYWLDKAKLNEALADTGYYYGRYPYYYDDYGLTWFKEENVFELVARAAPELKLVNWQSAGLEKHQDVYVYRKG